MTELKRNIVHKSAAVDSRAAEHWNRMYAEVSDLPWELDSPPAELKIWLQHIPCGGRVLDIGCGKGVHADFVASHGFKVTGIDISNVAIDAALTKAQQHAGLTTLSFYVADILSYQSRGLFAFAFDYSVFHHIPMENRVQYARRVYRLLDKGATFGLVCYSQSDDKARSRESRLGKYGNLMYHPSRVEVSSLFSHLFTEIHYNETTLGRSGKHRAHHFMFRKKLV